MSVRDREDCVRVTTRVEASPERAFALFTDEVDVWWRRGARFRFDVGRSGVLRFEGERFVEDFGDEVFEVGRITAWEPGARLAFDWRDRSFAPDETTQVEVRFEADGEATRVTLEHTGWARLPQGHPARLGLGGPAFRAALGTRWTELLLPLARHARGDLLPER